jgi:para-nitrobenzyl esterase
MYTKGGLRYKLITLILILILIVPVLMACGEEEENMPSPSPTVLSWTGNEVVQTRYGAVKGFADEANTWVWKAIPFASPPVGDLRWKAPQEPKPWKGVLAKAQFSEQGIQPNPITGQIVGSEDCLYLNVWRPQTAESNLPVYVRIYGGGNTIGSASDEYYWGANFASKSNAVFVSMNYRLGPLGWFIYPALRTGDKLDDSGNYGTLDIIQALKWVQSNVAAFGGNQGNVTIAGQSAGGFNVCSLLLSPLASGLFHKAISESGGSTTYSISDGEKSAYHVLLKLLVNDKTAADETEAAKHLDGMSNTEIANYLRSKPAQEFYAAYESAFMGLIKFPNIFSDGTVIVAEGRNAFKTGTYPNKVPTILGTDKDETKLFFYFSADFPDKDSELYQMVAKYTSDLWKVAGADGLARDMTAQPDQPNVFVYDFVWGSVGDTGKSVVPNPWGSRLGSFHGLNVSLFLGNNVGIEDQLKLAGVTINTEQNRPGRDALSDAIISFEAQFIRIGDPGTGKPGSTLPGWTPWSNNEGESKCILLDAGYDAIDIKMSTNELTEAGLMAEIDKLPAATADAIRKARIF